MATTLNRPKPRSAPSSTSDSSRKRGGGSVAPFAFVGVALVVIALVAVHVLCINRYGFFRDELYYIACAKRLDWGYVDHPPLSVALLKVVASSLDYPLWLVRTPAIACGAIATVIGALIARELGGKSFAQVAAAIAVAVSPTYLVVTHMYSMNSLDVMLWAVAAYVWVGLLRSGERWRWIILGVVVGLACINKLSGLWLAAGIVVATICTPRRNDLTRAEPWIGIALTVACLTPYVIWQAEHGWVTLDFMRNAIDAKLLPIEPWMFVLREMAVMNPVGWVVWFCGIAFCAANEKWRPMLLVWAIVAAILIIGGKSRENYLSPAYAFLLAPGAVQLEKGLPKLGWLIKGYVGVLAAAGFAVACIVLPLLDQPDTARLIRNLSSLAPTKIPESEVGRTNDLKGLADMNGWPEMAEEVDRVIKTLSPSEQREVYVYTHNYGEAAAIQKFSKIKGLHVIGRHNQYWHWGPGSWNGKVAVVVGEVPARILSDFESVSLVKRLDLEYAVPEESTAPIRIARNLKVPVSKFWAQSKRIE